MVRPPAYHDVGAREAFGRTPRQMRVAGRLVVVAEIGGVLCAFDALCPHRKGPMRCAEVEENTVVACPLHGWRFDLSDGGRELHGHSPLGVHTVAEEGGRVMIAVAAPPDGQL